MNPFTTIKKGMSVGIIKKVASACSTIKLSDVGKIWTVTGIDYSGRKHNRYISCVYLESGNNKRRAVVPEITSVNPNFEPEGGFIVCVGCGATIAEIDLRVNKRLNNLKECLSCGMIEPHES